MFNHAVESYQHGIEHYFEGSPKSRKFSLLHIDHSIELFLKEKMVDLGKSIYKSDGKTVSIHEAFSSLKKSISIPEQPRLEELHDLRNVIQHKGVLPDQPTMDFYAKLSYKFVKRFCNDEFGMAINTILPQIHIILFEAPEPISLPEQVSSAIRQAFESESNIEKVLGLYTAVELAAKHLAAHINDDEKLEHFIKENLDTTHHVQGMVRMAANEQNGAVDALGQVFGVRNLIVADDSIAPFVSDGNTSAPAYFIGANIADILLGNIKH